MSCPHELPTAAAHRCCPPLLLTAAAHRCCSPLLPAAAAHRCFPPLTRPHLRIPALLAVTPEAYQFHAILMGYRQALSLLLLASAIIAIQTSLNVFGAERPVFWRESRHYSIFAYLLGKSIAQLPLTCAYPFFYTVFFYQLLRPYAPFQSFYFVFLLMQWVGEGIGQLISLQLNSSRQLAGGVVALLCVVVTGSFPLLNGMGTFFNAISYLSFCRWGMVALLSVEFAPWYSGEPDFTNPHLGQLQGYRHARASSPQD